MKTNILLTCLLLVGRVLDASLPQSVEVNSDSAHYQNEALVLEGNVKIQYPLGKLSAHYARVEKGDGQAIPFEKIQLEKDVQIELQDGSSIACDSVNFSLEDYQATFSSEEEQSLVHYVHAPDSATPLKIDSRTIQLQLSDKVFSPRHSKNLLSLGETFEEITATGAVQASYDDNLIAYAETAVYYLREGENQGKMILMPKQSDVEGESHRCRILYCHNHFLEADKIEINPKEHRILCHGVEAIFFNPNSFRMVPIRLSCDLLEWSEQDREFICQGNVEIIDEELGAIYSPNRAIISCLPLQKEIKGSPQHLIQKIHFEKDVKISWETHNEPRYLHTPGSAILDRINLVAIFNKDSSTDAAPSMKQVILEDSLRKIGSNLFTIYYRYNAENRLNPHRYVLEGDIRAENRDKKESLIQYLWAQRIEADPNFSEMKLLSTVKDPVLFYDPNKNLEMSAKGLIISRGADDESSSAKGIGHVRFSLNSKEMEKVKGANIS
jgi:lipopolysaccharide export system protein LptA